MHFGFQIILSKGVNDLHSSVGFSLACFFFVVIAVHLKKNQFISDMFYTCCTSLIFFILNELIEKNKFLCSHQKCLDHHLSCQVSDKATYKIFFFNPHEQKWENAKIYYKWTLWKVSAEYQHHTNILQHVLFWIKSYPGKLEGKWAADAVMDFLP